MSYNRERWRAAISWKKSKSRGFIQTWLSIDGTKKGCAKWFVLAVIAAAAAVIALRQ